MLAAYYPCEREDIWLVQNYSIYGIREARRMVKSCRRRAYTRKTSTENKRANQVDRNWRQ